MSINFIKIKILIEGAAICRTVEKIAGMENSAMSERITVLIDHNIEWQAALLWNTLATEGWLELYHD